RCDAGGVMNKKAAPARRCLSFCTRVGMATAVPLEAAAGRTLQIAEIKILCAGSTDRTWEGAKRRPADLSTNDRQRRAADHLSDGLQPASFIVILKAILTFRR